MANKRTATRKKTAPKKPTGRSARSKKWSRHVTEHSNALDLEDGVFKKRTPKKIALFLKRSAEHSSRKKTGPYQSAMSMLNFYINRAGKSLGKKEKEPLEKAKDELKELFHRAGKS